MGDLRIGGDANIFNLGASGQSPFHKTANYLQEALAYLSGSNWNNSIDEARQHLATALASLPTSPPASASDLAHAQQALNDAQKLITMLNQAAEGGGVSWVPMPPSTSTEKQQIEKLVQSVTPDFTNFPSSYRANDTSATGDGPPPESFVIAAAGIAMNCLHSWLSNVDQYDGDFYSAQCISFYLFSWCPSGAAGSDIAAQLNTMMETSIAAVNAGPVQGGKIPPTTQGLISTALNTAWINLNNAYPGQFT